MPKLFPDSTRLGRATRPVSPTPANDAKPINEEQTEIVTATGGTRTLTFDGQTTSALAFDADAATLKAALEALSNIGVGNVSVESLESANEVQTVTLGAGNTGGNFDLTFSGQTALAIAYNATGAQVQTALEALSNIAPGDVAVSGGAGGPYVITFGGVYAGINVPKIVGTGHLTGGANTVTVTNTTQTGIKNVYRFTGALKNTNVPLLVEDTSSLTGGSATITKTGSSFAEWNARTTTQEALASKGQLRSSSQVQNDIEALGMRKPVDIGQPGRIPGER